MLGDELIGHLLALHGIHPESVETRLARVIELLRAALSDQGGTVELDRVDDTVAVVRVALGGRAPRSANIEQTVRRAVMTAVPELANVAIEPAGSSSATAFVPLDALMRTAASTRLP
jgi:Fe-S cluster biogenesis protein NfuA